jgi:hypothetical protein
MNGRLILSEVPVLELAGQLKKNWRHNTRHNNPRQDDIQHNWINSDTYINDTQYNKT